MASAIKDRGYSLAEVLIVAAIFLLVVGILTFSLVTCFRSFKKGESGIDSVRSVRNSISHLSRELREVIPGDIMNNEEIEGGAESIVFTDTSGKVRCFRYNSTKKEIESFEYRDFGTPKQAIVTGTLRIISLNLKKIKGVTFRIEESEKKPRLLSIEITTVPEIDAGPAYTGKTKVLMR